MKFVLGIFISIYVLSFIAINILFVASRRKKKGKLILLTGGGTGGHVYPLLAIYEEIKSRCPDHSFAYVGIKGKAEAKIIPRENIAFYSTISIGYPGVRNPIAFLKFITIISLGSLKCFYLLMKLKPDCIISTGGYVSAPPLISALVLRTLFRIKIKIFIHEQNTVPGQLNKLFGRWADYVFVSFRDTIDFFPKNGIFTGYPVRPRIFSSDPDSESELKSKIPENRKVVFVFGGSQGARTINRALVDALPYLFPYRKKIFIIHGMGLAKTKTYDASADTINRISQLDEEVRKELPSFYYSRNYFHNIGAIYKISHLIVSRSGAGTINEIAALGKPAVLIPKGGLPGDHQAMNARAMKQAGAAFVIYEDIKRNEKGEIIEFINGQVLARTIISALNDQNALSTMSLAAKSFFQGDAAKKIVDCIESPKKALEMKELSFKLANNHNSLKLPPRSTILQKLNQQYEKNPLTYNPCQLLTDDEIDFYRYKATRLLFHSKWPVRNVGVKLCGYLVHRDKLPELIRMITDRTPVSWWLKMLGGDFVEVGFIRRNAIRAITIMDIFNKDVEEALEKAMEDPYYEVRAEACRAVQHFSNHIAGKDKWLHKLLEKLEDPDFEVICEAAVAIGHTGIDKRAYEALLQLSSHNLWQVRHAALIGILKLLERHILTPSPLVVEHVRNFVLTSTDFKPLFQIKETYRKIIELCKTKN